MGFILGNKTPPYSDIVLVFEFAVAGLLVVGAFLAHRGHIRAHMYLQSSMVLVNIPVILAWMVPEYLAYVLPGLPGEIAKPFYWVPTVMLVAGAAAEALGIYIMLVAGTTLIPEKYRFRRYKRWMRTELILWWAVLLVGVSTYYVWYLSGLPS
ncbi:MAG: hypothetical protein L3K15_00300 [Thermoplasmata archaeon]|nr:hypothetical protein [Thermoplasmata archaeon]